MTLVDQKFHQNRQNLAKSLTPSERRKELLLAKMKREELEKQHEAILRLKQPQATIGEHLIEMKRKRQEIKFEIDRKEQKYPL